MNFLQSDQGMETFSAAEPSAEPAEVRRAVRYAAATNAKKAIVRQFPGLLAMTATTTVVNGTQKEDKRDDKKTV